jgi:hypothetical protein
MEQENRYLLKLIEFSLDPHFSISIRPPELSVSEIDGPTLRLAQAINIIAAVGLPKSISLHI